MEQIRNNLGYAFSSIFLVIIALQGELIAEDNRENDLEYLIDKTNFYIKNHYPDSAFNTCLKARTKGLSKDNMYLLLSDIYIEKEKYDSALVFNYGAGMIHKELTFPPIKILQQRYLIYKSLGWEKKAESIRDSILIHPKIKNKILLPAVKLNTGGGYRLNTLLSYDIYPWVAIDSSATDKGGLYDVGFMLKWGVPNSVNEKFSISIKGNVEKPYWQRDVNSIDLLYSFIGINLGLKNLPGPFNGDIGSGIKKQGENGRFWKNTIDLSCVKYNLFQLWYLNVHYNIDLDTLFKIDNQGFSVASSNNLFLNKRWGLNVLLSISGYFGRATEKSILLDLLYVSVEDDDVSYYTDSTFTEKIESLGISDIQLLKQVYESAGTVAIYNNIPQNRITLSGELGFDYDLNKVVNTGLSGGLDVVKYIDEYSWIKTEKSAFEGSLVALNKEDGKYYVFNKEPLADIFNPNNSISEEIADTPLLYEKEIYNRTLYRLRASLDIQFKIGKFGKINLTGEVGKEWNKPVEEFPLALSDWYTSVFLKWQKNFKIFNYVAGI